LAVPTSSTLSAFPAIRAGTIGQSLAAFGHYSHSGYAFKTKLIEILRGSGDSALVALANGGIEIAPYATGGSYASQLNKAAVTGSAASVHWDDSGAGARGSVCQSAWERMRDRVAGNKVQFLLGDQGQADSALAAGQYGFTPAAAANNWYNAWHNNLIREYRDKLDTAVPGKIAWGILGRSLSLDNTFAYERIRQKQLALVANNPTTMFKFETWDTEIQDSVHGSIVGQTTYGYRMAEAVAKNYYGLTQYTNYSGVLVRIYSGPTITSVSKAVDNVTVTVTITAETVGGVEDTISMPSASGPPPCGIAFWDASANMDAVFSTGSPPPIQRPNQTWSWTSGSGTKIAVFTLPTPITGTLKMAYPYDNVPDFNPDLVIKGNISKKPAQSRVW
jgi:hypothetical protein